MCGITGFSFENGYIETEKIFYEQLTQLLQKSSYLIKHRGPDDEGTFVDKKRGIGLAHRRLSILDTSRNGSQPMHDIDGQISIIFNGEIYNFLELRAKLEKFKKLEWRSNSDTEVILNLYK